MLIGLYDDDFMRYPSVIPNLEICKLYSHYNSKREMVELAEKFDLNKYGGIVVRKDYDDGMFVDAADPRTLGVGGLAYTNGVYSPLPTRIEYIVPNFEIYRPFAKHYGPTKADAKRFDQILKASHLRITNSPTELKTMEQCRKVANMWRTNAIIVHDPCLGIAPETPAFIKELVLRDYSVMREGKYERRFGNKFPIQIYNSKQLREWLPIRPLEGQMIMQYNGILSVEDVVLLCTTYPKTARHLFYNVSHGVEPHDAQGFFLHHAKEILTQVLFFRRHNVKVLLTYDETIIDIEPIQTFLDLMSYWLGFRWRESNFLNYKETLAEFCKTFKRCAKSIWAFKRIDLSIEQLREMFAYTREVYPELFTMFYQCDVISYNQKRGVFTNEYDNDPGATTTYSQNN